MADRRHHRYAFVFSGPFAYPPNVHDMKCFYISRELITRGGEVTWVELGGKRSYAEDGIRFEAVRTAPSSTLRTGLSLGKLVLFCLSRRIRVVYVDDWMFFRNKPTRCLAGVMAIRIAGIKVVYDERDPSVDFKIASGDLSPSSEKYRQMVRVARLSERTADLVMLTSKAYELDYISEGFPRKKVAGFFRGIDTEHFRPSAVMNAKRSRLGLEGKFLIGWFGLMHPFRLIREVLVPMISEISDLIPNAHLLIGGEGPLSREFQELVKEKGLPVTFLGLVPYEELPEYLSACDVLLCPVSDRSRFTRNSAWLKIPEALAVGRPVIATRTNISDLDYKAMRGVLWVEPTLTGFMEGLKEVHRDYPRYLSLAQEQAQHFDDYSVSRTIGRIVDRIESVAGVTR